MDTGKRSPVFMHFVCITYSLYFTKLFSHRFLCKYCFTSRPIRRISSRTFNSIEYRYKLDCSRPIRIAYKMYTRGRHAHLRLRLIATQCLSLWSVPCIYVNTFRRCQCCRYQ